MRKQTCNRSKRLEPYCSSVNAKGRRVTGKLYKNNMVSKMKTKYEKSKPATDLRGLYLIRDNACAHKCKLVQDFLERETEVQLHIPSYSRDLSPCDFFPVYFTKKQSLQSSILAPTCS